MTSEILNFDVGLRLYPWGAFFLCRVYCMLCCVREGSCAASVAAFQQAVHGWPLANFEQPVIPVIASTAWALRLRSHLRTFVSRPCDTSEILKIRMVGFVPISFPFL